MAACATEIRRKIGIQSVVIFEGWTSYSLVHLLRVTANEKLPLDQAVCPVVCDGYCLFRQEESILSRANE